MIRVKIIGAGGYGGVGITELLLGHPKARISALVDVTDVGVPMGELYPHLRGYCDMPIVDASDPKARAAADVVFLATPDGVGMQLAAHELEGGCKVIDYSGDFRFDSASDYAEYARRIGRNTTHQSPQLLGETVYGLAELHREAIGPSRRVVGNPGCFAVSCILGLTPAVRHRLIDTASIICDCKTGVSGAGKKPSAGFHYPSRYQNMNAYKLGGHQHVCEIERELGIVAGGNVTIMFTAHVIPLCRGIMSTLYASLRSGVSEEDVMSAYKTDYGREPFVRLYDRNATVGSAQVAGTNMCNLVVDVEKRTGRLRVVSYIDNLVKGQAGNALQNMNLLFGLPETSGLDRPGRFP